MTVSAELTAQVGAAVDELKIAKDSFELIREETDQKVSSFVNDINAQLINPLEMIFYLSSNGDDSNTGASASAPLLTVKEAIDRTPTGGLCKLYIADGETYLLAERTIVDECDLDITLGTGSVFEQSTVESGGVAGLILGKRQSVIYTGGTIRTINNASPPQIDSTLFARKYSGAVNVRLSLCTIELGDQSFAWGGQVACGFHELNVGYVTLALRAGRTQSSKLFDVASGCFSFSVFALTNNTGLDLVDLVGGIYRVNNLPINVVTNSSAVYGG